MTYRGVEICFANIMQASAKPCRVFPVFPCFSCLHQPNLRSPSYVMIMPVHDWSLSAWREYLERTRRRVSCRYRRCRCSTLLYLPCIFRLRTETIWVSATLRVLILIAIAEKALKGCIKWHRIWLENNRSWVSIRVSSWSTIFYSIHYRSRRKHFI